MQQGTADSFRGDAPQPASAAMIAVGTDDGDEVADQIPHHHAHPHGVSDRGDGYEEGQDEAAGHGALRGWSSVAGSEAVPRGGDGSGQGGAMSREGADWQQQRDESLNSRGFRGSTRGVQNNGSTQGQGDGEENNYLQQSAGYGYYLYGQSHGGRHDADADLVAGGDSGMEASGGPAAAEGGVVMTGPNQGEVRDCGSRSCARLCVQNA